MTQPADDQASPLRDRDAVTVVAAVGGIAASGLPLAEGLRVAAEESGQVRVARALRAVAASVEQGRDLGESLASGTSGLPRHLRGLVAAAVRCGQFDLILEQFLDRSLVQQELWWSLRRALFYPTVLAIVILLMFAAVCHSVAQQILELCREFEFTVSSEQLRAMWLSQYGVPAIAVVAAAGSLVMAIVYLLSSRAARYRLLSSIPLAGPLWHWMGTAEMARLLSVLVEHGIPQGESLRLAADAMRNADVADTARRVAATVDGGSSLADAVARDRLPKTLVPLVRWGESAQQLDDALRSAADQFERRALFRLTLLRSIVPPLLFLFVGSVIITLVVTVITPLQAIYRFL